MTGQQLRRLTGVVLVLTTLAFLRLTSGKAEERAQVPVKIGMVGSLLKEVPDTLLAAMQQPFSNMMAQQTGLAGELVRSGEAAELAKQLANDKVQLGIFYGVEFARVRLKYPELKPLMICVNKHSQLQAHLMVRVDSQAAALGDLRQGIVVVPKANPHHCGLFFQSLAGDDFQGKVSPSDDFEEALDLVVDGTVHAAVVDAVSLECYQRRKPGRFAKLRTLQKSVPFPCTCVAYHSSNGLDAATLKRFKQGMINANQTFLGKKMFNLFKMTAFQAVPANYEQHLKEIVKVYPPADESGSSDEASKP